MDKSSEKRCLHGSRHGVNQHLSTTEKLNKSFDEVQSVQESSNPTTSLRTLIVWNISKALEKNPNLNIKDAINEAQCKLEELSSADDIQSNVSENPCVRHFVCALLAWQELGHQDADSLYRFVENRLLCNEEHNSFPKCKSTNIEDPSGLSPSHTKAVSFSSQMSRKMGPVLKLPVETKIVMRMDNAPPPASRPLQKRPKPKENDIMKKIDQACCLDSECSERLASLDAMTADLRNRATLLARREAERVELLERAEAAWKDLELGYQRRLALAEEKEEDIARQIQKLIDERNADKNECTSLVQQLNAKSDHAEKDRDRLKEVERDVCELACRRLRASEEAVKGEACLAEQQCRAHQAERDLLFKEEQARRKVINLQSELDSTRALTHEAERAMREELSAIREQIDTVSKQLLADDTQNKQIKDYLEESRKEKTELVEDLEGCKVMCETRMQGKIDELKKKRDRLNELKDKVMECRCKLPIDVTVEVKRTPSLAALCRCTNADKILESCSCTSLRGQLMTNLLSELFGGLQSELGTSTVIDMPCQLLKCFEDKHNWDLATVVKTNLNNYFSRLLASELDIAIATSIEKYHAKWVGESCADTCSRMRPDPGEDATAGWQERAIEQRAQKLATELAEQLFNDRADELMQRAKEIASSGPPPCECKPKATSTKAAVYPCLTTKPAPAPPPIWHQAIEDVTQLRMQIQELKKKSIKKEDLKMMETKFAKLLKQSAGSSSQGQPKSDGLSKIHDGNEFNNKERKINRAVYYSTMQSIDFNRPISMKKKNVDVSYPNKKGAKSNSLFNTGTDKTNKPFKKNTQTYAVNMCLCSALKDQQKVTGNKSKSDNNAWQQTASKHHQVSSNIRNTKPISSSYVSQDTTIMNDSKTSEQQSCFSNCVCFHNKPSNSSIDKLFDTLTKWKCETTYVSEKNLKSSCILNKLTDGCILDTNQITNIHLNKKDSLKKINSTSLRSIDVLKTSLKNVNPLHAINDDGYNSFKNSNIDTQLSNVSKKMENSAKSSGPMVNKESEYIGAINLDKSNECLPNSKPITMNTKYDVNTSSIFTCDKSSKCEQGEEVEKLKKKLSCIRKDIYNSGTDIVPRKQEGMFKDSVLDSVMKNKNTHSGNYDETNSTDSPSKLNNSKNFTTLNSKTCDYQIKFLGVTLTDANSKTKDGVPLESKRIIKTNTLTNDNTLSKSLEAYEQIQHHDIASKVSNKSFPDNEPTQNMKLNESSSGRTINVHNNDTKECYNEMKCRICEMDQKDSLDDKVISNPCYNVINSCMDDDNNSKGEFDKLPKTKELNKLNLVEPKESDKRLTPCHCSLKFEELKNFINITFAKQVNDIGLDAQSFKEHKKQNESCVCCHKMNVDESKDMEENAFHLLQEYLRKKLNEFRESSCSSSCTPSEEEQNLITMVLDRIKNLISVSTNQIECKCSDDKGKTQGSWNRAYSLLQEYLKMKIKKVQCTCILTEDNTDTILPGVLEKICNLIEYDFQRLKDVCGCQNDRNGQEKPLPTDIAESPDNNFDNMLSGNFKYANSTFINNQSVNHSLINTLTFNHTNANHHYPQFPFQSKANESCSYVKMQKDNNQVVENRPNESHLFGPYCSACSNQNTNHDSTNPSKRISSSRTSSSNFDNIHIVPYKESDQLLGSKTIITPANIDANNVNNDILVADSVKNRPFIEYNIHTTTDSKNSNDYINKQPREANLNSDLDCKVKSELITNINRVESVEVINEYHERNILAQELLTNEKDDNQLLLNINFKNNLNKINTNKSLANKADIITKKYSGPYIGYTVDCSCNTALSTCVCSNFLSEADNDKINNIMKRSLPDDNYFRKVSYILKTRPIVKNYDYSVVADDTRQNGILKNETKTNIINEQETNTSFNNDDEQIRQKSIEDIDKTNIMINTAADNFSTKRSLANKADIITKNSSGPYIGYTVDCSCNTTLGTCVCSNFVSKADNDKINNIMKKSLPDENYFRKVSYILNSRPIVGNTNYSNVADDAHIRGILKNNTERKMTNEQETGISCNNNDELILKQSIQGIDKTNIKINTSEVNLDMDYSNNEDAWCECCSNIMPMKNSDSERLKTSIYYPVPVTDFEDNEKNGKMCTGNPLNSLHHKLPNRTCDCDLVPICHVKMLVENIETKLATAKCTCDSLIPDVCPEHKQNTA